MARHGLATLVAVLSLTIPSWGVAPPAPGTGVGPGNAPPLVLPADGPLACPTPSPCPVECFPLGCCNTCGLSGKTWVRAEYLLWWAQGMRVPPLLTGAPAGTPAATAGALGAPGTQVLYGNSRLNDDVRNGLRLSGGTWLDDECRLGLQGSFFILEGQGSNYAAGSADGSQIVARPFLGVNGLPDAQLVSFPGLLAGTARVESGSNNFLGADLALRHNVCCGCDYRVDLLGGYRYFRYSERLGIREDLKPLAAPAVPGSSITVRDYFGADNDFHGATLGVVAQACHGPWSVEVTPRLDVGGVCRTVRINGSTTVTVPGAGTVTNTGGLLAQRSNIGTYRSSAFALVPELDVTVGYRLGDRARLLVGYSWLYWTQVARAGDQIDPVVNRALIPPGAGGGPNRPAFGFRDSDLWVQGLRLGLELRF